MNATTQDILRRQLDERRDRLGAAIATDGEGYLSSLLREVDAALARMDDGTYGLCEACHDNVEDSRLLADPLCCFCLDHLSPDQRRLLESDLEMAARIQGGLLPPRDLTIGGWEVHAHYEPAGPVSGDYYDLVHTDGTGEIFFFIGDVSGKGVSASILMANLQAIFRSLATAGAAPGELLTRANRLFAESTLPSAYATLVCGRALPSGRVEIANAGHPPALLARDGRLRSLSATGLPLGLFSSARYEQIALDTEPRDLLLLYTDGISETLNSSGEEFGSERVGSVAAGASEGAARSPAAVTGALLRDLDAFRNGAPRQDDITVLALRQ